MNLKNKFSFYASIAWLYTKYQLLTKALLAVVVFPLFKAVLNHLIRSTGRVSVSSGDYLSFLFSLQGLGLLLLALVVLAIVVGVDINAFIVMSALIKENKIKLKAKELLMVGLKSLKVLCKPSGLLVMVYIALVVPLVGVGHSVSITKNFKIPNFITDVIYNNTLYSSLYILVLMVLAVITVIHMFFFHYLLIENEPVGVALKKSATLMKQHWKQFLKAFFLRSLLLYALLLSLAVAALVGLLALTHMVHDEFLSRALSIFAVATLTEVMGYFLLMLVPFASYRLTDLFYQFNAEDGYTVSLKRDIASKAKTMGTIKKITTVFGLFIALVVVLAFNFVVGLGLSAYFDDIFRTHKDIAIVAHRGGGDLAAENSLLGLEKAIEHGAKWSEIDVQRTKDGQYIINHDATFKRVAGEDKPSFELTLDEIKALNIKDLFNADGKAQPVPTLEEFLNASKGRIGLFIELKGKTADEKMVDDVVTMVKAKAMENEVALLSLDYPLITYIEDKYPEMQTGYLYFFSIGDTKSLKGDFLVMEEQEATSDMVDEIHNAGKKAVVWTVNTPESIEKFVMSNVDGIITDYVDKVKEGMHTRDNSTDFEIIMDAML